MTTLSRNEGDGRRLHRRTPGGAGSRRGGQDRDQNSPPKPTASSERRERDRGYPAAVLVQRESTSVVGLRKRALSNVGARGEGEARCSGLERAPGHHPPVGRPGGARASAASRAEPRPRSCRRPATTATLLSVDVPAVPAARAGTSRARPSVGLHPVARQDLVARAAAAGTARAAAAAGRPHRIAGSAARVADLPAQRPRRAHGASHALRIEPAAVDRRQHEAPAVERP